MRWFRWFLLLLLLCAATVEPERADGVRYSDDYATDACDNPQGYAVTL